MTENRTQITEDRQHLPVPMLRQEQAERTGFSGFPACRQARLLDGQAGVLWYLVTPTEQSKGGKYVF